MNDVAPVSIAALDAVELIECLEFLHDLFGAERDGIGAAFDLYTARCYSLAELRADLARFVFVLGGDGERFVHGDDR